MIPLHNKETHPVSPTNQPEPRVWSPDPTFGHRSDSSSWPTTLSRTFSIINNVSRDQDQDHRVQDYAYKHPLESSSDQSIPVKRQCVAAACQPLSAATMLPDAAIDSAAEKLAEFRRDNALTNLLEQYEVLIQDYKRLKSDYEEAREARENYKKLARGQASNPFALVVVDGDGYIFDERFVTDGEEGGSRAAKRLNDAIKNSLRSKGLESCDVMIRVYANLVGLSKTLHKNGLAGAEKRSLSSFTAGFNRSYGLADFIDAGELKENADFKLKAILRLYADNAQCKHIYFAACHDVGYISDLTPFRGNDRFTLVRTPSLNFHGEFNKLKMNVEELYGVFRETPLTYAAAQPKAFPSNNTGNSTLTYSNSNSTSTRGSANDSSICQFYARGNCKYGSTCRNSHMNARTSSQDSTPSPSIGTNTKPERNFALDWRRTSTSSLAPNVESLPKKEDIPDGYVAINAAGHRLDTYIAPDEAAAKRLRALTINREKNYCNNKQLYESCENEDCEYDHSPIPEDLKPALEYLSRSVPCSNHSACRKAKCVFGHVCQKMNCARHRATGGKETCRFLPKWWPPGDKADYIKDGIVESDEVIMSPTMDSEDARNIENGGTHLWD
ncbi:hypothetical protein F66182_838 [Fusarium sp. NRRL 66182]|nr:hypothetical protein F66182_838 [Fusarium sp. NRRL 66182]